MSKGLDYSKWANISTGDSDSEEERTTRKTEANTKIDRAWTEIAKLQQVADGIFYKAEESSNLEEYHSAQKHYEEVLRLLKCALELQQQGGLERAEKHVLSCNLNTACCYLRASSWENASKHCTSALKLVIKISPIEELRARYLRMYANVKVLMQTVDVQEQYQAAGVATREKIREDLLSELEKDASRIKDLPLLCPQLLDDAHVKSVLDAEDLRRKAEEVLQRYKAFMPSGSDKFDKSVSSREKEAAQARQNDVLPEVAAPQQRERHAPPPPPPLSSSSSSSIKSPSDGDENASSKISSGSSQTRSTANLPILQPVEASIASMALQQASSRYRGKDYSAALSQYVLAIECLKSEMPSSTSTGDESTGEEDKSDSRQSRLLLGIAQSGKGCCLVSLQRHEEALPDLQQALSTFTVHVAEGLRESASSEGTAQQQEQVISVARHIWNTIDHATECQVKRKDWMAALKQCEVGLALCKIVIDWIQDMLRAQRDLPSSTQKAGKLAQSRRSLLLLAKGHVLKEIHELANSSEGTAVAIAYAQSKGGKAMDSGEVIEDLTNVWDVAAVGFSEAGAFVKAADTFGLVADLLADCAGRLDKRGPLQAYMDWHEAPRSVNQGMAERAYVYYNKQGVQAERVLSAEIKRRGQQTQAKVSEKVILPRVVELNDESDENLLREASGADSSKSTDTPAETRESKRELYALYRVMQAYFMAGVAALHVTEHGGASAADAVRALEAALEAHRSFIASTRMDTAIDSTSQEWRDYHSLLGDCAYHAALAYFRRGKWDYSLEMLGRALSASHLSEDRTRRQHALGLRALALTMKGQKDLADSATIEAGATALAPLESSESITRQVKEYILRNAPRQLTTAPTSPPPKMHKIDPEDAARGAARKKEEEMRMKAEQMAAFRPQLIPSEEQHQDAATAHVRVQAESKSLWHSAVRFLTGDGLINIAAAWLIIIIGLLSVYLGYRRVLDAAARAQLTRAAQTEEYNL